MTDISGRKNASLGILFVFLLLVSGCLGGYSGPPGNPNWSLSVIDIDTSQTDDYIIVQTTIGLQGQHGQNTQVFGTRVCAINDDGEILDTIDVGEVSSNSPRHNISFKLKEVPAIIALGYKSVDSPISHDLQGRKRVGEDRYRPFYQNRSRCSPTKLLQRSSTLVVGNYFNNNMQADLSVSTDGDTNPQRYMPDWTNAGGVAWSDGSKWVMGHVEGFGFGTLLFTKDDNNGPTPIYYQKPVMDEVGHLLGAGQNDDHKQYWVAPDEVYSGDERDRTWERIEIQGKNPNPRRWSVMSKGWNDPVAYLPMDRDYVAYSIEELLTFEFNHIDSREA